MIGIGQTIHFPPKIETGNDSTAGSNGVVGSSLNGSYVVYSPDLSVIVSPTTHTSGSSSVATRNITNYPWEEVYIPGNMVAVHCTGAYLAYGIKAPKPQNGMVRIIHRKTGVKGLVKNIKGLIKDISFAHIETKVLLGFTDHFGSLFVYEIWKDDMEELLQTNLMIEIPVLETDEVHDFHRVVWCLFIPDDLCTSGGDDDDDEEEEEEESFSDLLVVTNGSMAEIWHLSSILKYISRGVVNRSDIQSGYCKMENHLAPIIDAAFSPDGTALATAGADGTVKFFQVYMAGDSSRFPRCLHQWSPHNGEPLSCLFFLDNHKHPLPDMKFWKYAVTGACNNTELKVWSCETWQCTQTIKFKSSPNLTGLLLFKAAIDPSSRHLVLSDLKRRVLYILVLNQEVSPTSTMNGSVGHSLSPASPKESTLQIGARVVSITELSIQYPAIFLAVREATWKPYKRWKHHHLHHDTGLHVKDEDDGDEESDETDVVDGLVLRCILINTKSLQDAVIRFQPAMPFGITEDSRYSSEKSMNVSQDLYVPLDGLSDLSMNRSSSVCDDGQGLLSSISKDNESLSPKEIRMVFGPSDSVVAILKDSVPVKEISSSSNQTHSSAVKTPIVNVEESPHPLLLLTPDSFSSPHKMEGDELAAVQTSRAIEVQGSELPVEDLKSAALALLLSINSSPSIVADEKFETNILSEIASNLEKSSNILEESVSGSRVTPSPLPPLVQEYNASRIDCTEAPLATSETSQHDETVKGNALSRCSNIASSTSSPSLEVQQILHMDDAEAASTVIVNVPKRMIKVPIPPVYSKSIENEVCQNVENVMDSAIAESMVVTSSSILEDSTKSLQDLKVRRGKETLISPLLDVSSGSLNSLSNTMTCKEIEAEIRSSNLSLQSSIGAVTTAAHSTESALAASIANSIDMQKLNDLASNIHDVEKANDRLSETTEQGLSSLQDVILRSAYAQDTNLKALVDMNKSLTDQVEKFVKSIQAINKQIDEIKRSQVKLQENLPHILINATKPIIESSLRAEVRNSLPGAINKGFEPIRGQILSDVHCMVSQCEGHILENLNKLLYSRSFSDQLSTSMSSATTPCVQSACRDAYSKVVIPGFNAISQQVFSQLNEAFVKGTKEYMLHIETESISNQNALKEGLKKANKSLDATATNVSTQVNMLIETLHKNIKQQTAISDSQSEQLRSVIREEVSKVLKEYKSSFDACAAAALVASRAQTPALTHAATNPKVAQQQIQSLISQGQFNAAFKQALTASDLALVVFVCERINPQTLFNSTPCTLSQDVLLSLINQLAHDLTTFTDLKTKYLEEAVINLDPSHTVTREHMQKILTGLQRELNTHLANHPNHKKLKMLLMAVNHLVTA